MQLEHGAPPSGFQGLYLRHDSDYLSALASITLISDGSFGTVDMFMVDSDLHSNSDNETTLSGNAIQVYACGTPEVAGGSISQVFIDGGEVFVSRNLWCSPSQFHEAVALELVDLDGTVEENQTSGPLCDSSASTEGASIQAMSFTDVNGLTVQGNWILQLPSSGNGSQPGFDVIHPTHLTVACNAIVAHNAVFAASELGTANFAFNTVLFTESSWWEEDIIYSMIGLGSILGNVHHNVLLKPSPLEADLGWPSSFTNNVFVVSSLGAEASMGITAENSGFASTQAFLCDVRPWSCDPHLTVELEALQGNLGDSPAVEIDSDPRPGGSHWGADANSASCGRLASPSSATD